MVITQEQLDQMTSRPAEHIEYVVIHHTVMNPTNDIEFVARVEEASQGFVTVGYNAYARLHDHQNDVWDIQMGRPLDKKPAAQYGLNDQGYAIAVGGNYQPGGAPFLNDVSENALKAVAEHILEVKKKCPNLKYLIGHRDVAAIAVAAEGGELSDYATECPGDGLYARLHDLRVMTGLHSQPGE